MSHVALVKQLHQPLWSGETVSDIPESISILIGELELKVVVCVGHLMIGLGDNNPGLCNNTEIPMLWKNMIQAWPTAMSTPCPPQAVGIFAV